MIAIPSTKYTATTNTDAAAGGFSNAFAQRNAVCIAVAMIHGEINLHFE